ncbi:MAG TPA: sulfurtransferase [Acidimicrobiia bacterium]|jgi:thiosulfate/3-mercaptopyruvate sulfurtransferase|nr:sulfurtransferase [Acidimicrobiia bacterium]HIL45942.1 sulfurtransferase [Acidimicrobiia bacterium]
MDTFGPLVSAQELEDRLDTPVLCDVRWYTDGRIGREEFESGHIPGAVFVDLDQRLASPDNGGESGRHPFPAAQDFAHWLGSIGVSPTTPVVAYDNAGGFSAGRLVWMLRILGHPAALLNGGLAAWSGPLSSEETRRPAVSCPIRPWPEEQLPSIEQVAAHDGQIVDARGHDRFRGDNEPLDAQPGHIPGAVSSPFVQNMVDGYFLSPEALRQSFADQGIDDAQNVISSCGSGVTACHNLLAMEHAGLGRGRLFVGSWSAWSRSDQPIATGE